MCKKHFWLGKFMCTPSFLLCAHLMTCVQAHTRTAKREHWCQWYLEICLEGGKCLGGSRGPMPDNRRQTASISEEKIRTHALNFTALINYQLPYPSMAVLSWIHGL